MVVSLVWHLSILYQQYLPYQLCVSKSVGGVEWYSHSSLRTDCSHWVFEKGCENGFFRWRIRYQYSAYRTVHKLVDLLPVPVINLCFPWLLFYFLFLLFSLFCFASNFCFNLTRVNVAAAVSTLSSTSTYGVFCLFFIFIFIFYFLSPV